jgi:hypothetical protein
MGACAENATSAPRATGTDNAVLSPARWLDGPLLDNMGIDMLEGGDPVFEEILASDSGWTTITAGPE